MGILTIEETTLSKVQTFESVEAMNEAMKGYKLEYELTQTDGAILDAISRYACKYTGVCFLSKQKIAEEAGFSSRPTAIRACNRMMALGIMKQHETRRVAGDKRRSVNIIVIQPFVAKEESAEVIDESQQKVTAGSHTKEAFHQSSLKTNTYKETNIETDELLKRGLKTAIPEAFYHAFSTFFDGQTIYDMYGVLLRAKAKTRAVFMLEDYAEEYLDHFYNVIRLYKQGKVENLASYLYVTWERVTSNISRRRCSKYGAIFREFEAIGV